MTGLAAGMLPLSLVPLILRMRQVVAGTALVDVCVTPLAAALCLCWSYAGFRLPSSEARDVIWYMPIGILLLLVPVAALGARRPTTRVWPLFVLLPLAATLGGLPLLAASSTFSRAPALHLEEPLFAGYCLVLLMGAGNYIAWPNTILALGWAVAALLVVAPACPSTSSFIPEPRAARLLATVILPAACWLTAAILRARRRAAPPEGRLPIDVAWIRFRDLFGMVWGRRVQEAFNEQARRAGLPCQLTWNGLVENEACRADAQRLLAWLLQKFVDDGWIAKYLAAAPLQGFGPQGPAK
jgi:hypothetical protein